MNITHIWEHPAFMTSRMVQRPEIDSASTASKIIAHELEKRDGIPRHIEIMAKKVEALNSQYLEQNPDGDTAA